MGRDEDTDLPWATVQNQGESGQGTFGFVFEAIDLHTGETVAIKSASPKADRPEVFQHEGRISEGFGGGASAQVGLPKFHCCSVHVMARHGTARLRVLRCLLLFAVDGDGDGDGASWAEFGPTPEVRGSSSLHEDHPVVDVANH